MIGEAELLAAVPRGLYIGGVWQDGGAGTFPVIDPATGRPASEGVDAARTEASRAAGTGPAQAAAEAEPSTEAGSARG